MAIYNFLISHQYSSAITPKLISSPTARDFYAIFTFLVQRIDPNYTLPEKDREEEVLSMFKLLGYPHNISKSALKSVGSSHTWSYVLFALAWLCEYCNYSDAVAPPSFTVDADELDERMFFEMIANSYAKWMVGEEVDLMDGELSENLDRKAQMMMEEKEKYESEINVYKTDVERLKNTKAFIRELEQRRADCASDEAKFQHLVSKAEKSRTAYSDKLKEKQQILAEMKERRAALEHERESLNHVVKTQDITPQEVLQLSRRKDALATTRQTLLDQKQKLQTMLQEADAALGVAQSQVEEYVNKFNDLGRKLQLLPANAKYSQGRDLTLYMNTSPEGPILNLDLDKDVRPALTSLKGKLSEALHKEMARDNDVCKQLSESKGVQLEREERVKSLEARVKRTQETMKAERERIEKEIAVITNQLQDVNGELRGLQGEEGEAVAKAEAKLAKITAELEKVQEEQSAERAIVNDAICRLTDEVAQHMSDITDSLSGLEAKAKVIKTKISKG